MFGLDSKDRKFILDKLAEHQIDLAALRAKIDDSDKASFRTTLEINRLNTYLIQLQGKLAYLEARTSREEFLDHCLSIAEDLLGGTEYAAPYRVIKEKLRERHFPLQGEPKGEPVDTDAAEILTETPTPTPTIEDPTNGETIPDQP